MPYDRLTKLVTRIAKHTATSDLQWEESAKPNAYQVAFPDYTVMISEQPSRDAGPDDMDYILSIYDDHGKLIESISDVEFGQSTDTQEVDREWRLKAYRLMRDTFTGARRKAMGVDAALDKILEALPPDEEDIPF